MRFDAIDSAEHDEAIRRCVLQLDRMGLDEATIIATGVALICYGFSRHKQFHGAAGLDGARRMVAAFVENTSEIDMVGGAA